MRAAGLLLLLAGWGIVLAAVLLLKQAPQAGFVLAGFCVELLGLILVFRSHLMPRGERP